MSRALQSSEMSTEQSGGLAMCKPLKAWPSTAKVGGGGDLLHIHTPIQHTDSENLVLPVLCQLLYSFLSKTNTKFLNLEFIVEWGR